MVFVTSIVLNITRCINIYVNIPNFMRQTRVSVFFFRVAGPQKCEGKVMCFLRQAKSSPFRATLTDEFRETQLLLTSNRHAYVLTLEHRRPYLNPTPQSSEPPFQSCEPFTEPSQSCVSRNETDSASGRRWPMQQKTTKSQNNPKEWKPNPIENARRYNLK